MRVLAASQNMEDPPLNHQQHYDLEVEAMPLDNDLEGKPAKVLLMLPQQASSEEC
jgi:hypothetical protein